MSTPKVLVLGAGGVGGYYGGRLVEAGCDVTFLVRERRQQLLQQNGLRIESPAGSLTTPVKTVVADELGPDYDYIFFTCKAYDLDDAIASVAPAMIAGTTLVPFLNGLAHLDRLNEIFGAESVLGGAVVIQATLDDDGVVRHLNDTAFMMFGEQAGGASQRTNALAALFDKARGVNVSAVPDIMQRMWNKWLLLSALAGMTCLMRANVGEITRARGGRQIMEDFLRKNAEIAAYYGYPIPADVMDSTRAFLIDEKSQATASMLRDLEQGGRIESDHLLGDLLQRANGAGIKHPALMLAFTHLKAYEERRKRAL